MIDPAAAIDVIAEALRGEDAIRALFLSGSYGVGMQDGYSDLDFVLVSPDGPSDRISEIWRGAAGRTGELVLWRDRGVRPNLINVITQDWLRIDVVILAPEQMAAQSRDTLRVVFDRDGIYEGLVESTAHPLPDACRTRYQFEEFIRILGLLSVAAGREEYLNGVTGIFHLRNLLVDLLVAETGAPNRGGALHLNRLITDEQKTLLEGLPPPVATRDAMIAAHLAYAEAYIPRARRLAPVWGVDWPERFETATWQRLRETLAIEPPYE